MSNIEKGQSLLELLISLGVFVSVVSALAVLVLDSYASGRLGQEMTAADFLAEEGLEAARSIRDNNWLDLSPGNYGLKISGSKTWVFDSTPEDISSQLGAGATRIINVENMGIGRKKITSRVTWQFSETRPQEIALITYLTDWARSGSHLAQLNFRWRNDDGSE